MPLETGQNCKGITKYNKHEVLNSNMQILLIPSQHVVCVYRLGNTLSGQFLLFSEGHLRQQAIEIGITLAMTEMDNNYRVSCS